VAKDRTELIVVDATDERGRIGQLARRPGMLLAGLAATLG